MKTVVIAGAGQIGSAAADLLDANRIKLLAFADNDSSKWTGSINGHTDGSRQTDIRCSDINACSCGIPVMSFEKAVGLSPDIFLIGVLDQERSAALSDQIKGYGFRGQIMLMKELHDMFDIRTAELKKICRRLEAAGVPGAAAELGVYKGDLAWQIEALMPERKLFLFDTFAGFDEADTAVESEMNYSAAEAADFSDTALSCVYERLRPDSNAEIRKGRFPETAAGLENESFAFVSLDADLYAPTLAGLDFFYPRLNAGGIILLHDYGSSRFTGVKKAVEDYEQNNKKLCLLPLADMHSSCVIIHP